MEIGQVFYLLQDGELRDDFATFISVDNTYGCVISASEKHAARFNTPNEALEYAKKHDVYERFERDFKVKKYVVKDIWLEHVEHQTEGFDSEEAQILAATEPSKTDPKTRNIIGEGYIKTK